MSARAPRVGCGAAIVNEGRILLVKRLEPPEAGHWNLPGGKVDFLERVEDAVVRETREEVGVEIALLRALGVTEMIGIDDQHWVSPIYLARVVAGEPRTRQARSRRLVRLRRAAAGAGAGGAGGVRGDQEGRLTPAEATAGFQRRPSIGARSDAPRLLKATEGSGLVRNWRNRGAVIASDSQAIQIKPSPQTPSLDRFALLAMTSSPFPYLLTGPWITRVAPA